MVPVEVGALSRPVLQKLYRYWKSRCHGEELPSRHDVDPLDVPSLLPYVILVDVLRDPMDFRYRLIGTNTVNVMGRDSTGKTLGQLGYGEDNIAVVRRNYERCVKERRPLFTTGRFVWAGPLQKDWLDYEFARLPLAGPDGSVDKILCGLDFWSNRDTPAKP